MYITTNNVRGWPGSTPIVTFWSYSNDIPWDYNNLPPHYYHDWDLLSGFYPGRIPDDKCIWLNLKYKDIFGQLAYTGPMRSVSISSGWKKVLGYADLEAGDGIYARLTKSYKAENRPTLKSISTTPYLIPEMNVDEAPTPYFIDNEYVAFHDKSSIKTTAAVAVYHAGYMASSGDMTGVWPPELIEQIGGNIQQGRVIDLLDVKWSVYVPTLAEFKRYMGTAFQTGIMSDQPPVTNITLPDNIKFITSTPSPRNVRMLVAIDNTGTEYDVDPTDEVDVMFVFRPTLK
ncbi:virion structural protein [Pseudomonas phage SL2]|nr:virion structural protein [Pseudomonas phage SL2]ATN94598.1 virion structural protein [Pseudomonas phage SL2]QXN68368.1 virion structural protein [Pseudomonas phage PA7]